MSVFKSLSVLVVLIGCAALISPGTNGAVDLPAPPVQKDASFRIGAADSSAARPLGMPVRQRIVPIEPAQKILCTPTLQWEWDGPARSPQYPQAGTTPVVVQLTDDNADGRITDADIPDVAFLHEKAQKFVLTAVDGAAGTDLFTISDPLLYWSLAAGDIDGDGIVELISVRFPTFPNPQLQLVAFEHTGELKWVSDPAPATPGALYWQIGVADLDQDGQPEIFAGANVFNADGTLRWAGTEGVGSPVNGLANAADLLPENPGMELLAGRTVYDAWGGVVWNRPDLPDGLTAVGDLNGDGQPEIVLTDYWGNDVYLLDRFGNVLGHYFVPEGRLMRPIVADVDGDLSAEAVLVTLYQVRAMEWTDQGFVTKWSLPASDLTGDSTAIAFDFDGDGASEILYRNESGWYILDGGSGVVLSEIPFPSATLVEAPVVADIDNDGLTEIVVGACWDQDHPGAREALAAWECSAPNRARPIWNEYMYHICNVNEDGTIPQFEVPTWLVHDSWIAQAGPGNCAVSDDGYGDEDEDGDDEETDEASD
jgi:hypothetical protein